MTFDEIHSKILADSPHQWQRYVKSIPLALLRTYYAAGQSARYSNRLLHVRGRKIVPFAERMVNPFPPIVKNDK